MAASSSAEWTRSAACLGSSGQGGADQLAAPPSADTEGAFDPLRRLVGSHAGEVSLWAGYLGGVRPLPGSADLPRGGPQPVGRQNIPACLVIQP
jgi:hypothetical protein